MQHNIIHGIRTRLQRVQRISSERTRPMMHPNRRLRLLTAASALTLLALCSSAALAQDAADQIPAKPKTVPEATEPTAPVGPGGTTNQPATADAQTADAATDAAPPTGVEEITVTAERREQSQQKVSISATVLSANEIARRGVVSIADLQQVAPSVAINTVNRSTFINIRGVGLALSAPTSSTGVAYYVDGLFIPSEQTIGLSFFDVGAIEVLRGPQGTLTGQNSTGGAIYVRTPEPKFDRLSGFVEQTFGNYNQFRTTAAVNVPISSTLALRVAGTFDKRGSFSRQLGSSPSRPGNVDFYAVRANLRFDPAPGFKFNLRWDHYDSASDNNAVTNRNLLPTLGPFRIAEDAISYLRIFGDRYSAEARINLTSGVQWRTNVSYQHNTTLDQADGDRTSTALPVPANLPITGANRARFPGRVSNITTEQKYYIAETNLLSTGSSPFQWVLGAFYLNGTIPLNQLRDERNTVNFVSSTNTLIATAKNTTKAAFGQINFKPVEAVELIAGARYSADKQVFNRIVSAGGVGIGTAKSDKITGRMAVNVYPVRDVMLYVSASRGYKAGGVNLTIGTPNFKPETNTVFETGFKITTLRRQLRLNGDVFYSDYKDIQFSSLVGGFPTVQNAASAKAWGAELEATGQFGALSFNGGFGYLHARFAKDVCLNNGNNPAGTRLLCPVGATATTADELVPKGRTLPLSPSWTINAGIQYEIELGNGMTITPRVQYSRITKQYGTAFPNALLTLVPARDVVDVRLTLVPSERYRVELYSSNLFNKTYIASQIQDASSAQGGILWGAPRQFGVRGTVKLGPL
jgi:iron complex outermembrane receptor protein